jgi:hypothetical protein
MMGLRFATKKAIKEAIGTDISGKFQETSIFGAEFNGDGEYTVVGPDAYNKRNWYATVTIQNGVLIKVK